jgi:hypothetical protein
MNRDLKYEKNNKGYDFQYTLKNGGGIKCKNYILCDAILPNWWFSCKGNYLCTNCHMMFGTWKSGNYNHIGKGILEKIKNKKCPIYLEFKDGVLLPRCNHSLCIICFKRCYYGEEEPQFPYPNIEDEYYDDENNNKWNTNYPLIKEYLKNLDKWKRWDEEKNLMKCPLCRK